MAAIARVTQQLDALSTLKEILDLAKNPDSVIEAHEEARKQMVLTESMQAKYDDAVMFIQNYEKLSSELDSATASLNSDKENHAKKVQEFEDFSKSESSRLAAVEISLKSVSDANVSESDRLKNIENKLIDKQKSIGVKELSLDADISEKISVLNRRESKLNEREGIISIREEAIRVRTEKLKAAVAD